MNDLENKMNLAVSHFEKELSSLRTSRANPSMLDNIFVDAYGSKTPLNQLGNISTPDPNTITIQIWDTSLIKSIENAIKKNEDSKDIITVEIHHNLIINFIVLFYEYCYTLYDSKLIKKINASSKKQLNHKLKTMLAHDYYALLRVEEIDDSKTDLVPSLAKSIIDCTSFYITYVIDDYKICDRQMMNEHRMYFLTTEKFRNEICQNEKEKQQANIDAQEVKKEGFTASIQGLRGHCTAIYDATIIYEGNAPTLKDLVLGKVSKVQLHVKRFELDNLTDDKTELNDWITERFYIKDEMMAKFKQGQSEELLN